MDSDEVNSINDTVESTQVALLVKGVYYDIASDLGLPEHETLFELTESGDSTQPTLMTMPTNVLKLNWVKYDNIASGDSYQDYQEVKFMEFQDFLERQNALREHTSGVGQMNFLNNLTQTFEMMYWTDRQPQFYTTTDDFGLLFDAYDVSIDTTGLEATKTMAHGRIYPEFVLEDAFTPDLDASGFSYLVNKAKTRAFLELKQQPNQEAAAETRRQKIINQKLQRTVEDIPQLFKTVRYGRRSPSFGTNIARKLKDGS
jgi:hypothetical protein